VPALRLFPESTAALHFAAGAWHVLASRMNKTRLLDAGYLLAAVMAVTIIAGALLVRRLGRQGAQATV